MNSRPASVLGCAPTIQFQTARSCWSLLRLGVDNVMLTRGGKGVLWGCSAGSGGGAGRTCGCGRHRGSRRCIQCRASGWSERGEEHPGGDCAWGDSGILVHAASRNHRIVCVSRRGRSFLREDAQGRPVIERMRDRVSHACPGSRRCFRATRSLARRCCPFHGE